jgi:SAM-dependent methyltransferase
MKREEIDAALYKKKRYSTPDQFLIDVLEKKALVKILSKFAPYRNALDVPCGYGRNGERIKKFCKNLVGCDISMNMISEARRDCYSSLVIGDIKNLPFEDNSFDLVVCIRLFHHFELEEIKIALDELLRVSSSYILFSFYAPVQIHKFFRKIRGLKPRIKMFDEREVVSYLHKRARVLDSRSIIPLLHSQRFILIKKLTV